MNAFLPHWRDMMSDIRIVYCVMYSLSMLMLAYNPNSKRKSDYGVWVYLRLLCRSMVKGASGIRHARHAGMIAGAGVTWVTIVL